MRNHTRNNNLNPHRIPNVAKYRGIAERSGTWARMVNSTDFNAPNGCWQWRSSVSSTGYGLYIHHEYGPVLAHRLALHVAGRSVPVDMTVDHLCMNKLCVNPEHLEIVTIHENILRGGNAAAVNARKTHCIHGHEFTPENTAIYKGHKEGTTQRACRTCLRERYLRKRAA